MERKDFIETLKDFKEAYNHLVMALHDESDPDFMCDLYPFDRSFDELMINEWIDEAIRKLKLEESKERQKIFLKIIQMLENRNWEYEIVKDHIEIELGNEFYKVSKYDFEKLQMLYLDIKNW